MLQIKLGDNRESLKRPSWTQDNLNAYRDKYTVVRSQGLKGRYAIIKDYYVKSKGLAF